MDLVNAAPGATGTAELVVAERDTARALGSGDLDVLGSPRVAALAEEAAVAALAGALAPEATTVGSKLVLEHLAPTAVGAKVRATARLTEVERRRLSFEIEVVGDGLLLARLTHDRVVVERARFLAHEALQGTASGGD